MVFTVDFFNLVFVRTDRGVMFGRAGVMNQAGRGDAVLVGLLDCLAVLKTILMIPVIAHHGRMFSLSQCNIFFSKR